MPRPERDSLAGIKGVTPALESAFWIETERRTRAERRRAELEAARLREEEEARRAAERDRLVEAARTSVGTAEGRRALAQVDFLAAAKAALAVGGAQYLEHRKSSLVRARPEYTVRFRHIGRRFECVVDQNLRIVDAGICLVDHRTGVRWDNVLTLESLPSVIREADAEGKLVVFRRV
jgi:hypothetical protein